MEQKALLMSKTFVPKPVKQLFLIGAGGTGSYLAQGLAKLLCGYRLDVSVALIDPDVIEEKNLYRQNFMAYEVGQPKAQALALRLNQQFGLRFGSHVGDGVSYLEKHYNFYASTLVVSCVDSVAVRRAISHKISHWLDTGNGREFGQAIYGTTDNTEHLRENIQKWAETPHVNGLPSPHLKLGNWQEQDQHDAQPSCAEMSFFAEQSVYVNEWAAQAALNILHQILVKGVVNVPAIYFDCAQGRMTPARITKEYLQ